MNRFVSRTSPSLSAGTSQLRAMRAGHLFFSPDNGGGNGGSGGDVEEESRPNVGPRNQNAADVVKRYDGDAVRMASQIVEVERDNYRVRGQRNTLQRDYDAIKDKVPAEGGVVLTKEQAADWNAYQDVLKEHSLTKADEVKKILGEAKGNAEKVGQLEGQLAAKDRGLILRDVATDMGWKLGVLTERDELTPGLAYEKKPVTKDGKTSEVWHVKYKDGEGESATLKVEPLSEFAASHARWKDYGPALLASGDGQQQEQSGGMRVAEQGSGGKPVAGSKLAQIRQRNEAEAKKANEGKTSKSLDEVFGVGANAAT